MPSRASAERAGGVGVQFLQGDGTGEQLAAIVLFLLLLFGFGFGFLDFLDEIELLLAKGFEVGFRLCARHDESVTVGETESDLIELRKANRERDFSCVEGQIRFRMEESFLIVSVASHVMFDDKSAAANFRRPSRRRLASAAWQGARAPRCIPKRRIRTARHTAQEGAAQARRDSRQPAGDMAAVRRPS